MRSEKQRRETEASRGETTKENCSFFSNLDGVNVKKRSAKRKKRGTNWAIAKRRRDLQKEGEGKCGQSLPDQTEESWWKKERLDFP